MATPREQHGARAGARVVGSARLDGREPLVEDRSAAADAARPDHDAADAPRAGEATDAGSHGRADVTPDSALADRNDRYAG